MHGKNGYIWNIKIQAIMKKFLLLTAFSILLLAGKCKKEKPQDDNPQEEQLADASLNVVKIPGLTVQGENVTIRGVIQNFGDAAITSMDIVWQVDNGTEHSMSLSGLNIGKMGTYNFQHSDPYQATTGQHTITVTVKNVNGKEHDKVDGNNVRNASITVASQGVTRRALYEEFTSSTCNPCATFNGNYFTSSYINSNRANIAVIKYQMNWPGNGDPYYTAEGGTRRQYYGVNGVPTLYLDGTEGTHFNQAQLQGDLDAELQVPGVVDLQAYYTIDANNNVKVKVVGTPYLSGNFTMHVAVVEQTTTGNVASNGETEFYNVMMKMVPDANGTALTCTDGAAFTERVQASLNGTNIEEMTDLQVIVFVQDDTSKAVLQAAIATEDASQIDF